jgi:hypothetical protein
MHFGRRGHFARPSRGAGGKLVRVYGPVVKGRRVEVRTVRPNQRLDLRVDPHLIENTQVPQWPEKLPGKHRQEVDPLLGVILKSHKKRVWRFDPK